MKKKKEWYLHDAAKLWIISHSSYYFHSSFFRQYDPECDRGIGKVLGSISAVSRSLGGSFSSTAAYNWA